MPALALDDLLTQVAEFVREDPEHAREFARAILKTDDLKPVADHLGRRASNIVNNARQADTKKIADLEAQVALLRDQMEEKEATLEEMKSAAPDWKRRIEEQEKKHTEKVRKLEEELGQERTGRVGDMLDTHLQRFLSYLSPGVSVDEDYAREVMLPKYRPFVKVNPETRAVEVYEADGSGSQYDDKGGDPLRKLAADALRDLPARYKLVPATSGGGGTGGGSGGAEPARARTVEEVAELRKKSGLYAF